MYRRSTFSPDRLAIHRTVTLLHIVGYLLRTMFLSLFSDGYHRPVFEPYCDSSFMDDPVTRRSTEGYLFQPLWRRPRVAFTSSRYKSRHPPLYLAGSSQHSSVQCRVDSCSSFALIDCGASGTVFFDPSFAQHRRIPECRLDTLIIPSNHSWKTIDTPITSMSGCNL